MTLVDIFTRLYETGIPVAYNHFNVEQTAPYIIYYSESSNFVRADNRQYIKRNDLTVELYTNVKDIHSEELVEQALEDLGLIWERTEVWLETEKIYLNTYITEVI